MPVHLPPKELAALRLLLANAGRIVTAQQLRQALWGDVHVTADSVPKCVSSLRARLEPEQCIQTVYKRGYRLTADVRGPGADADDASPRLAILPFATEYGVPEHLGPVVAEETIARLGGTRPAVAAVLAQDSVFTLANRGLTALETGEKLRADLVLAGVLRALPMHFRLRVEMIRVEDGTQLWVEDLLVERSQIAGLESELVKRLKFRLSSKVHHEAPPVKAAPTPAAGAKKDSLSIYAVTEPGHTRGPERREAFETFQRAHHEWQTLQRHRMQDGLQHLLRATELDPALIGARVDLVNLCVAQGLYGYMSPAVAADIVRRTAESVSDTTSHAEAILPALGWIQFHVDRDLSTAISAFSLSANLPHNPWITRTRNLFALSRHRFGEAIDLLQAGISQDPYSPWLQTRLAWAYHLAGEADSSVDQIRSTLSQFPEHEGASFYGAVILAFNGETARAAELAHELAQRLPHLDLATEVHAYTLACAGHADEAHVILERLEWLGRERFLLRAFTPAVYVALGNLDAALTELRAADEMRCPWFFQMLADPRLKPLEERAEFQGMLALLAGMEADAAQSEQQQA